MASLPSNRSSILIWTPFVLISILTFFLYESLSWYWWYPNVPVFWALGGLGAASAIRVLAHTGLRSRGAILVFALLVIGQWWWLKDLILLIWLGIAWGIMGYRP